MYNMAAPPRLDPPVNPLLATAGRDELDQRWRVFLRANMVSATGPQIKGVRYI